ncbi:unnamed protein product, partial [Discosporangium mesarthrocarpum]
MRGAQLGANLGRKSGQQLRKATERERKLGSLEAKRTKVEEHVGALIVSGNISKDMRRQTDKWVFKRQEMVSRRQLKSAKALWKTSRKSSQTPKAELAQAQYIKLLDLSLGGQVVSETGG